jgi:multimeric flavodoxin WrbA
MTQFNGLSALFINCTLKKSPELSHTDGLISLASKVMQTQGVNTTSFRAVDYDIPPGIQHDMRDKGYDSDSWPELSEQLLAADILVMCGPIWLGENSSVMRIVLERMYATSSELNEKGQYKMYGKVAGSLISGNEDGVKHASMGSLFALQHIGYTIPPEAATGWLGTIGPGKSYLDEGSGGPENDFTNLSTTTMAWNLMYLAKLLKDNHFFPQKGNSSTDWASGIKPGFDQIDKWF